MIPAAVKPSTYKRIATLRPAFLGTTLKSLLRIKRRVVKTERGDFLIDPASNLGFTILEHGVYEPEVTRAMLEFLTPASSGGAERVVMKAMRCCF
jgi:hypothetical protein